MGNARITFEPLHPWAIVPAITPLDRTTPAEAATLYEQNFRWVRRTRAAELCMPWRLGQQIGWTIRSPVDVCMTPLEDVEVALQADPELLSQNSDIEQLWRRKTAAIGLKKSSWLALYDFRVGDGWQAMFVPNGQGTVEWHLGWTVTIPGDYFALILPHSPAQELIVPYGVLPGKLLSGVCERAGFTLAAKPTNRLRIARGDPIARLIILHPDSLSHHLRTDGDDT